MDSKAPLVTVLFPVYNGQPYLREAIDSMLAQSFTNFELLILNDGSRDGSLQEIESYRDPRIRLVNNEHNLGLIQTLNKGIGLAKGTYIARMDQDDVSAPGRLQAQLDFFQFHPDASLVACFIQLMSPEGQDNGTWPEDIAYVSPEQITRALAQTNCIAHPTVMGKANVFREFLYSANQTGAEDWDLWMRLAAAGHKIYKIPEKLLRYRIHATSLTSMHRKDLSGEQKMMGVKRRFLLGQIRKLHMGIFEGRVLYSWLRNLAREYKVNRLPVWIQTMKRLFVDSPFKAARQYAELKTAMQESNSHSGIFLLFPYLHMGGAEKVHVAIAESVADQRPWIIIAGFSTSAVFAPDFRKHGKLLDIPHAANHPFYARRVRAMLAQFISAQHRPVVLGCANFLFYDLVGQVSPQVQCIDLKHDFRLDLDTQVEQKLLKTYLRMNQRVFISQRAIQETIRFYSSNFVNRSFLDRIHLILNWVPVPPSAPRKNSEGPLRVLYAGRGTKEKRAQLVCRLAAEVHKRAMPCTFTVAGDIREAVKEEDYPFVRFLGEVRDAEEMKKIYADAQVILITSQREGFPMAIMEGMANGAVPVSSPVGDIPRHLEEGLNGFVTRTEQEEPMIEEMLDILNKLAADRTLLNTLSGNAYRYAFAHFQKENFVSAYRHLMGLQ